SLEGRVKARPAQPATGLHPCSPRLSSSGVVAAGGAAVSPSPPWFRGPPRPTRSRSATMHRPFSVAWRVAFGLLTATAPVRAAAGPVDALVQLVDSDTLDACVAHLAGYPTR